MSKYDKLLQDCVNTPYDDLVRLAELNLQKIFPALEDFFEDCDFEDCDFEDPIAYVMATTIANCLGADGKLTALERRFVNDILNANHSHNTLVDLINSRMDEDHEEMMINLVNGLDEKDASAYLTFCLCLLACDETITAEENAFFRRLLNN